MTQIDSVLHSLYDSIRAQASDVLSKEGVQLFQGQVTALAGTNVSVRRAQNTSADGQTYPVVSPTYKPAVGDWVWCMDIFGGVVVLGREQAPGDHDVQYVLTMPLDGQRVVVASIGPLQIGNAAIGSQHYASGSIGADPVGSSALINRHFSPRQTFGNWALAKDSVTTIEVDGSLANSNMAARGIGGSWALILATVTGNEIAGRTVQAGHVVTGTLTSNEVAGRSLSSDDFALQTITNDVIWNGIKDPAFATFGLRSLSGTGTLFAAASADHTHSSTPFVHYERAERLGMLEDRKKLQEHAGSMHEAVKDPGKLAEVLEVLAKNTLTALQLQVDYKQMNRDEIEEKLDEGGPFAEEYRERNLMHMDTRHHPLPHRPDARYTHDKLLQEVPEGMPTLDDMSPKDVREHLDSGGHFSAGGGSIYITAHPWKKDRYLIDTADDHPQDLGFNALGYDEMSRLSGQLAPKGAWAVESDSAPQAA